MQTDSAFTCDDHWPTDPLLRDPQELLPPNCPQQGGPGLIVEGDDHTGGWEVLAVVQSRTSGEGESRKGCSGAGIQSESSLHQQRQHSPSINRLQPLLQISKTFSV